MTWDGNGSFVRTKDWTNDRDASVKILASRHDENDDELRDGIAAALTKDGQSKPTADFKPNADVSYSLGSAALRWIRVWISESLKFKQATYTGSLQANTLTGDKVWSLPDTGGVVVVNGISGVTPDIENDWLFIRDTSASDYPALVNMTTYANAIASLAAFNVAASSSVAGNIMLATVAETAAGGSGTKAVTPAGLAQNISLTNPGHIKCPGGLIINFGYSSSFSGANGILFTYSAAFQAAILGFSTSHGSSTSGASVRANPIGLTSCTLSMDGVGGGSSGGFVAIGY